MHRIQEEETERGTKETTKQNGEGEKQETNREKQKEQNRKHGKYKGNMTITEATRNKRMQQE